MGDTEQKRATEEPHLPELFQLAVILFPGFLTLRVSEYFAFSPKVEGVELIASALAATLLDFGIAVILVKAIALLRRKKTAAAGPLALSPGFILLIATVAITTGMLWAVI